MDGQVYWVGQDGNIWLKNANGTFNQGPAANSTLTGTSYTDPYYDPGQTPQTLQATRIADPLAPTSTASAPSSATVSAPKVFNQAGAENTQRTIDQIPELLRNALLAEGANYDNTVGGFSAAEGAQRDTYGKSTVTNQQNYDANFMDSIRSGIKGLGGLMSLLRGTGAGGGTAQDIARDTVGGVTAQDIRGGADTRDENQTALDSSLSTFLTDLKTKRTAAGDTRANNERAIRRDSNTQLQDLFGKMAGFYGDVGNTAGANDWMGRAGALTPQIAADSNTQVSPYDTTPVIVHAPNLTAFAPPTEPSVTTAPDGRVGSGIFTMTDPRRKKDTTATPVPALAGA